MFITTALLGAGIVSAWLARHYFRLGRWRDAVADWRFRAVALAGTGGDPAAGALAGHLRLRPDQHHPDGPDPGRLRAARESPGRGDPLAGGAADRDRGRDQADAARVRAVLPGPPRLQGPRLDGRRILRLHRPGLGGAAHRLAHVLDQDPAGHRADRRSGLRGQPLRQGPAAAPGLPDSGLTSLLWLVLSLALAAVAALVIKWAVDADENFVAVSATAVLMLLISPVSWSHHWVWMAVALPCMGFAIHRVPSRDGKMRLAGWIIVAASAVAFYLTPKYLAVMAGAHEWGKDPQTQWQLIVASLGVVCGMAMLVYWALAYRPSRTRCARARSARLPASCRPAEMAVRGSVGGKHCREMSSRRTP